MKIKYKKINKIPYLIFLNYFIINLMKYKKNPLYKKIIKIYKIKLIFKMIILMNKKRLL